MSGKRCRGSAGSGAVTMIVLMFAATFGGLVWLSVDADRTISDRSTAHSIAFQSARSGAQAFDPVELRVRGRLVIDPPSAVQRAEQTAVALADSYGVVADVARISVVDDTVTVRVSVTGAAGEVSATATVRAVRVDGAGRVDSAGREE